MESQAAIELQRRMLMPDLVHPADQFGQTVTAIEIARFDLILLRVEILFAPWFDRHVLGELESAVDAVARAERGGQNQTHLKRWTTTVLQVLMQDIRRIREQIGAEVFANVRLGELLEVFGDLLFRIPPREIRVRL